MDIDDIKKEIKKRKNITNDEYNIKGKRLLKSFIIKTLILVVIGILVLIFIKKDDKNKDLISQYVFEKNISFSAINNFYKKHLGNVLPFDNLFNVSNQVFSEKLKYKSISKYKDGISLKVEDNYLVPCLKDGIVTFIGDKDGYGKTIVVESEEVVIWYANLDNTSTGLYDSVAAGLFLGETLGDKLYLVFKKDGKVIDYNEYL